MARDTCSNPTGTQYNSYLASMWDWKHVTGDMLGLRATRYAPPAIPSHENPLGPVRPPPPSPVSLSKLPLAQRAPGSWIPGYPLSARAQMTPARSSPPDLIDFTSPNTMGRPLPHRHSSLLVDVPRPSFQQNGPVNNNPWSPLPAPRVVSQRSVACQTTESWPLYTGLPASGLHNTTSVSAQLPTSTRQTRESAAAGHGGSGGAGRSVNRSLFPESEWPPLQPSAAAATTGPAAPRNSRRSSVIYVPGATAAVNAQGPPGGGASAQDAPNSESSVSRRASSCPTLRYGVCPWCKGSGTAQ